MTSKKTVILVDGSYYLRRTMALFGSMIPSDAASLLSHIAHAHLFNEETKVTDQLVRIYFYICEPLHHVLTNPISKESLNTSDLPSTKWRTDYLDSLKRERHIMIRLGYVQGWDEWKLKPEPMQALMNKTMKVEDLKSTDVTPVQREKGVDVKIGMDITRIALKRVADKVILVAGDGDFVPVVDLAREEGMEVVLDTMGGSASRQLIENVDYVRTFSEEDIRIRMKWKPAPERKEKDTRHAARTGQAAGRRKESESSYEAGGTFD